MDGAHWDLGATLGIQKPRPLPPQPCRHNRPFLGHKQPGILGVYNRYAYLDERRAAFLKWEQLVIGPVDPASKVVPLGA